MINTIKTVLKAFITDPHIGLNLHLSFISIVIVSPDIVIWKDDEGKKSIVLAFTLIPDLLNLTVRVFISYLFFLHLLGSDISEVKVEGMLSYSFFRHLKIIHRI